MLRLIMLKPIFHFDAKPFALGTGVGLDPQCYTFDRYVASLGHMHSASQHESVTQAGPLRIEGLPLGP